MDEPDDTLPTEAITWQVLMESLAIGATRGMADSYAIVNERTGRRLQPLDEHSMFQAAVVLAATLLEDSPECADPHAFEQASEKVGRDVLGFLQALRAQREQSGETALETIIDKAGLERRRQN